MIEIANTHLQVQVNPKGAELTSLKSKSNGINYMWKGDPAWWSKHSPVLFPVVGSLKNDRYNYQGKEYHLPRHGFAREKTFEAFRSGDHVAKFLLKSDEEMMKVYPFPFELELRYVLEDFKLIVSYKVFNPADTDLYFCLGAHPAFAVPLENKFSYEDYYLEFEHRENAGRFNLSEGLLLKTSEPFLQDNNRILLSPELFKKDAIVLKHLKSDWVSLKTAKSTHGLRFGIAGWPYLGIWAAANAAPFVCIEPWQGHADETEASGEITDKPGIVLLPAKRSWEKSWWVELF